MKGNHTVRRQGYSVSYWKNNTACGSDDTWDRATINAADSRMDVKTQYELRNITALLIRAFEAGERAKLKEIQNMLGIKENGK